MACERADLCVSMCVCVVMFVRGRTDSGGIERRAEGCLSVDSSGPAGCHVVVVGGQGQGETD